VALGPVTDDRMFADAMPIDIRAIFTAHARISS